MGEYINSDENNAPEILHYYSYRNTSVKLVRSGDKYIVTTKKNILYLFKRIKRFEYTSLHAAEDKYLEIKSELQYRGRSW